MLKDILELSCESYRIQIATFAGFQLHCMHKFVYSHIKVIVTYSKTFLKILPGKDERFFPWVKFTFMIIIIHLTKKFLRINKNIINQGVRIVFSSKA